MLDTWSRLSLGEATISFDSLRRPVRSSDRVRGPYPYWGASGVVDYVSDYLFDEPALLVSEDGENLKTRKTPISFYVSGKYWVNNHAHVLRARDNFDLRFLAYQVGCLDVSGYLTGSTQPKLTARALARLPIVAPPLGEQQRIAGVLGTLDDLINTNEQLADDCAALRRALLGAALGEAATSTPLSALARFVNGKNFTKDASGLGLPVIRTPEVRSGPTASTIRSDVDAAPDLIARRGDILFVWSGSLLVERWQYEDGLVNQHIFKVVPNEGVPDWLVYGLIERQMPWFLGLAADKATTMGHIQRRHLDVPVRLPGNETVLRLSELIEPLWEAELELLREAQELRRTRDELLPLLMSGKVRVRDLEPV